MHTPENKQVLSQMFLLLFPWNYTKVKGLFESNSFTEWNTDFRNNWWDIAMFMLDIFIYNYKF